MAVDYKPLNRHQEFSTPQKAALKKIFGLAEAGAASGTGATGGFTRTIVHTALSGHFSANADRDIKALFKRFREEIGDQNSSADLSSTFGAMCFESTKKKVLKTMAETVIADIV